MSKHQKKGAPQKASQAPTASSRNEPRTQLLRNGKTLADVMAEYLPGEDEAFLDFVLWGCTGFPTFWGSDDPEDSLRMALAAVRWKLDTCKTLRGYIEQYEYEHGPLARTLSGSGG